MSKIKQKEIINKTSKRKNQIMNNNKLQQENTNSIKNISQNKENIQSQILQKIS